MGDMVSSWLSRGAPTASASQLETTLGRDTLSNMASKAGISMSTATSARAFLIPRIIQRVALGGVLPTHLPRRVQNALQAIAQTKQEYSGQTIDNESKADLRTL